MGGGGGEGRERGGRERKDTVRNFMMSWIGMKKGISSESKSDFILMEDDEQKNF